MTRIAFGLVLLVFPAFSVAADDAKFEEAKQAQAALNVKSILLACQAYSRNPANEKAVYPIILLELVKPSFGGASYLRDGEKDLLDPWGKPAAAHREMFDVIERCVPPMIDHFAWLMSETV